MNEGEDPRARLRPFGSKARGVPPDLQERFLESVLGEALVTQDAEREPVRDASDAVVELRERVLVPPCNECDESLVGKVCVLLAHGEAILRSRER